jgi:hypothetical protein
VTFTEQNGVPATIDRIELIFIDVKGTSWTPEKQPDQTITIPAKGHSSYTGRAQTNPVKATDPDFRGGTVMVNFSGTDANDNVFSGSVSATLAKAPVAGSPSRQ